VPHHMSAGTSAAIEAAYIHGRTDEPAAGGVAAFLLAAPDAPDVALELPTEVAPGRGPSATGLSATGLSATGTSAKGGLAKGASALGARAPGVSARSSGVTMKPVTAMAALGLHSALSGSVTPKEGVDLTDEPTKRGARPSPVNTTTLASDRQKNANWGQKGASSRRAAAIPVPSTQPSFMHAG
jgi:hypothetical protein